jgi:hypothetical protein
MSLEVGILSALDKIQLGDAAIASGGWRPSYRSPSAGLPRDEEADKKLGACGCDRSKRLHSFSRRILLALDATGDDVKGRLIVSEWALPCLTRGIGIMRVLSSSSCKSWSQGSHVICPLVPTSQIISTGRASRFLFRRRLALDLDLRGIAGCGVRWLLEHCGMACELQLEASLNGRMRNGAVQ